MTTALIIQHASPEGPYTLADEFTHHDIWTKYCQTHMGEPVPDKPGNIDALVIMGGPMSATSDDGFPTRADEIALITASLEAGIPILGICLGAQLLAVAAGASVHPGDDGPEIGWGTVHLTDAAAKDDILGGLPTEIEVLHWHADTFEIPKGATHLAKSTRCKHQAFRTGKNAWGLQFHLEVDEGAVRAYLSAFGGDATAANVDPDEIAAHAYDAIARMRPVRHRVFTKFCEVVTAHGR